MRTPTSMAASRAREFHEKFSAAIGLHVSFEEFRVLWGDMFESGTLLPESLLEQLYQDYRMLIVSNTNELHFKWIVEHYSVVRHFDDCVLSYQVGSMKPHTAIFREAVRRAECRPRECFFTDDKAENISAAAKLGIDAVQFIGVAAPGRTSCGSGASTGRSGYAAGMVSPQQASLANANQHFLSPPAAFVLRLPLMFRWKRAIATRAGRTSRVRGVAEPSAGQDSRGMHVPRLVRSRDAGLSPRSLPGATGLEHDPLLRIAA